MAGIISLEEFEHYNNDSKENKLTSDYRVDVYLKTNDEGTLKVYDYEYELKELMFIGKAILESTIYKDILDVLYHDVEITSSNNKLLEYTRYWAKNDTGSRSDNKFIRLRYLDESLDNFLSLLKWHKTIHKEETLIITDLEYDRYISKSKFLYPLLSDVLEFESRIAKLLKESTDRTSSNYSSEFNHLLNKVYNLVLEFKNDINNFYNFYYSCFKVRSLPINYSSESADLDKDINFIKNKLDSVSSSLSYEEINNLQNIVSFYNNKYNLNFNKMYVNPFSKDDQTPIAINALDACMKLLEKKKIRYAI